MIELIQALMMAFMSLGFSADDVKDINEATYDQYQARYEIITADEGEGIVGDIKDL